MNKNAENKEYKPPTIRTDKDVGDNEPHVRMGNRKASLPPPIETPYVD